MASAFGSLTLIARMKTDALSDGSRRAAKEIRGVQGAARRLDRQIRGLTRPLARAGRLIGTLGSGLVLFDAGRTVVRFGRQLSVLRALTRGTAGEIGSLEREIRRLAATTEFTAADSAEAAVELGRAGLGLLQISRALPGTLALATIGQISMADSARLATDALKGMRLEIGQTDRVVDALAAGSSIASQDVTQLGEAFTYAAPFAAQLEVSLEQLTGAIATLADRGLKASAAGTGLRQFFIKVERSSKEGRRILARYGLTTDDVRISTHGLVEVLRRLRDAGFGAKESLGDLSGIFGARAGSTVALLIAGFEDLIPNIEKVAAATASAGKFSREYARIANDNVYGALLRIKSQWDELILTIARGDGAADGFVGGLRDALDGMASTIGFVRVRLQAFGTALVALLAIRFSGRLRLLAADLTTVAAGAGAAKRALVLATIAVKALLRAFLIGAVIESVFVLAGAIRRLTGPFNAVKDATVALFSLLVQSVVSASRVIFRTLYEIARSGATFAKATKDAIVAGFRGDDISDAFFAPFEDAIERIKDEWNGALADLVLASKAAAPSLAVVGNAIADSARATFGIGAGEGGASADEGGGGLVGGESGVGGGLENATEKARTLGDVLRDSVQPAVDSIGQGILSVAQGTQTVASLFGRIASGVLSSVLGFLVKIGLQQILIAAGVRTETVARLLGIATVSAAGSAASAKATAEGAAAAAAQASANAPAAAGAAIGSFGAALAFGAIALALIAAASFAEGGRVSGPGGPRSDSILARLSNGEFVVPAAEAGRSEHLLDEIRGGGLNDDTFSSLLGSGDIGGPSDGGGGGGMPPVEVTLSVDGRKMARALSESIVGETGSGFVTRRPSVA